MNYRPGTKLFEATSYLSLVNKHSRTSLNLTLDNSNRSENWTISRVPASLFFIYINKKPRLSEPCHSEKPNGVCGPKDAFYSYFYLYMTRTVFFYNWHIFVPNYDYCINCIRKLCQKMSNNIIILVYIIHK